MRRLAFPLLLVLAAAVGARAEAPAAASDATLKALEKAALDLARKNRPEEMEDVLEALARLGRPSAEVRRVRDAAGKALEKAGKRAPAVPEVSRALRKAAADLLPVLAAAAGEEDRRRVAEAIVLLDGAVEPAQEALGRVRVEGRFAPKDTPRILARRAEIAEALRKARRLEVPVTRGESALPLFARLYGKPGTYVRWDQFSLHSVRLSPEKLERIVRETVRGVALSNFLRTGEFGLPRPVAPLQTAALGTEADYRRAVEDALADGGMDAKDAAWYRTTGSFEDRRGWLVSNASVEAYEEATYVYWLFRRQSQALFGVHGQPCLNAGHLNWVCLSYLGAAMPQVAYVEVTEERKEESGTVERAAAVERREMRRLAEAGVAGTRAWVAWLAARREDPPWTSSMLDELGKIAGEPLLKATVVAEYLQETGEFADLWKATAPETAEAGLTIPQTMERGLGQPFAAFESRWREWLLPLRDGAAQRLEATPAPEAADPVSRRLLARLDAVRRQALEASKQFQPMRIEPSLSKGCAAHARYLAKHPEQAAKWPDAHEEYADREGFSPEGGFAGLHGVIAPGVDGPEEAIDSWMGTFYHRTPLLEPGLRRVGWGYEGRVAVLDVGSMVGPADAVSEVLWPPHGAKDVPTRFNPELPNPVPGEDQSAWGYPVTLQIFHHMPEPLLRLRLHEGSVRPDHEVACHLSSPDRPTNVELVPRLTWCLIPKAPLESKTTYSVVVEGWPDGKPRTTTFTTR